MSRLSSLHGKKGLNRYFFGHIAKYQVIVSVSLKPMKENAANPVVKKTEFVYVTQDEVLYTNRIPCHCTQQSKSALINTNTTDNELYEPVRPFWNYPHGIGNPACA